MKVTEFDFELPEELIAQEALSDRSASKLLVLDRKNGGIKHAQVKDLGQFLRAGDLIVVNNSKVLPARLLGRMGELAVECFLLKRVGASAWEALIRPGKRIGAGQKVEFERDGTSLIGEVKEKTSEGKVIIELHGAGEIDELLNKVGHVPLPPYIKRGDTQADAQRYQTVYAKQAGSVAAPTAGLHFTPELMGELKESGVEFAEITLHVGYGTFQPVRVENVEDHKIDAEIFDISFQAAEQINKAIEEGRRVIAVGTTTTRTLEYVAKNNSGRIVSGAGSSDLFIYPGFEFRVISGLMTNFHLPQSSLLMLVSAFAGKDSVLRAYGEAVKSKYRFYSYGDCMLIVQTDNG